MAFSNSSFSLRVENTPVFRPSSFSFPPIAPTSPSDFGAPRPAPIAPPPPLPPVVQSPPPPLPPAPPPIAPPPLPPLVIQSPPPPIPVPPPVVPLPIVAAPPPITPPPVVPPPPVVAAPPPVAPASPVVAPPPVVETPVAPPPVAPVIAPPVAETPTVPAPPIAQADPIAPANPVVAPADPVTVAANPVAADPAPAAAPVDAGMPPADPFNPASDAGNQGLQAQGGNDPVMIAAIPAPTIPANIFNNLDTQTLAGQDGAAPSGDNPTPDANGGGNSLNSGTLVAQADPPSNPSNPPSDANQGGGDPLSSAASTTANEGAPTNPDNAVIAANPPGNTNTPTPNDTGNPAPDVNSGGDGTPGANGETKTFNLGVSKTEIGAGIRPDDPTKSFSVPDQPNVLGEIGRIGVESIPLVGPAIQLGEAATGRSLITNRELSDQERGLLVGEAGLGLAAPGLAAFGKAAKGALAVGEAAQAAKVGAEVAGLAGDAANTVGKFGELATSAGKAVAPAADIAEKVAPAALQGESINQGVTRVFSVASGDSPVQTEQKGAVAGVTGLATGALAPGSNLGGEAVKDLSLPAVNVPGTGIAVEGPAVNTGLIGAAGGAGNVVGQAVDRNGDVNLPDTNTLKGNQQIAAEALTGGALTVVSGASGSAIGQTAGRAAEEAAGKLFGQGAAKVGEIAGVAGADAAVNLPTNTVNNVVTNGFAPALEPLPPLDTAPAEAVANAVQDGTAQLAPPIQPGPTTESIGQSIQDGTAQLELTPNPIPAAPASDAAPPIGGDSGTPIQLDSGKPIPLTGGDSGTPLSSAAPPTGGDSGVTTPTTPVENAPIADAPPIGGDAGANAPTPPVENAPIAAQPTTEVSQTPAGSASDAASSGTGFDLASTIQNVNSSQAVANAGAAFNDKLQQTGAVDPSSFAAVQDTASKVQEVINNDPGVQSLVNSAVG
jgi:Pre-toxin TG